MNESSLNNIKNSYILDSIKNDKENCNDFIADFQEFESSFIKTNEYKEDNEFRIKNKKADRKNSENEIEKDREILNECRCFNTESCLIQNKSKIYEKNVENDSKKCTKIDLDVDKELKINDDLYDSDKKLGVLYNMLNNNKTITSTFFGTKFEDSRLEDKFQEHLSSIPNYSIYFIIVLKFVFYISFLIFGINQYYNLAYTIYIGIALLIHIITSLFIIFYKVEPYYSVSKYTMFSAFFTTGCFNILLLTFTNTASSIIYLIKNLYLIGVIIYVSYSYLIKNSKFSVLLITTILLACVVISYSKKNLNLFVIFEHDIKQMNEVQIFLKRISI